MNRFKHLTAGFPTMLSAPRLPPFLSVVLAVVLTGLMTGPAQARGIPPAERDAARQAVDEASAQIVQDAIARFPEAEALLAVAEGYLTIQLSAAQLVVLGGAAGLGVLTDFQDESRTYLNIRRADVGPGLGANRYRLLVIFQEREALERVAAGSWEAGFAVQGQAGSSDAGGVAIANRGYRFFNLSDSGANLAATARLLRTRINRDLTDTGLADISIPMTGGDRKGKQIEGAPRQWDRALPFLAQKVIDEGYDLPLPYGVGINYAYVDQDQNLGALEVGLNGGEIVPYDFVAFENAVSLSDSAQLKADLWLFPFLNVYAMIGRVDGDAELDVFLDGNGILDQLEEDCSGIINSPLCRLLQDRVIDFPVRTTFSGTTYGLGFVLAGGWKDWFVTIPANWTYADMDTTFTDGKVLTVTPRFGKVFPLGSTGSLALFAGGNYLDSRLNVTGQVSLEDILTIDYRVRQSNVDRWNGVLGFNWDFNRRWSWNAEYNGFFGSREAFITGVTRRF